MNSFEIEMSEKERINFSSLIEKNFGIKMPPVKKVLLTSRLSKRLHALGFKSYSEYYNFLVSDKDSAEELHIFADLVSTHETSFFREPQHFEYLYNTALPRLIYDRVTAAKKQLRILSSACSTGEEAYTIALTLEEFFRNNKISGYTYKITGTDISTRVVNSAVRGVYHESRIAGIPHEYKRKYFMKGKGQKSELVRIIPEVRANTVFHYMNLMEDKYPFDEKFDIIFFRNAMIYFDRETQQKILSRLSSHLRTDGYLFIGHSETMSGYTLPLRCVATTVYRRV